MRAIFALFISLACAHANLIKYSESRPLMGTQWTITLYAESETRAKSACATAFAEAEKINVVASDYDVTSETSRLNFHASTDEVPLSPELADLLKKSIHFAQVTEGRFDPTLGTLTQLWRESKRTKKQTDPQHLHEAKQATGWQKIHLRTEKSRAFFRKDHPALRLDFGAIGKGYANDQMASALHRHTISRFCLVSGGDVLVGNPPPEKHGWRVELPSKRILFLKNCAISTSGSSHQHISIAGISYSHIISPQTGLGMLSQRIVTILAKNATMADALATAAVQLSHPEIAKSWGATQVFVSQATGSAHSRLP